MSCLLLTTFGQYYRMLGGRTPACYVTSGKEMLPYRRCLGFVVSRGSTFFLLPVNAQQTEGSSALDSFSFSFPYLQEH